MCVSPLAAAAPPEPKRRRYTSFPDELPAAGVVVDHSAAFERDLLKSLPVPASLTTDTDLSLDAAAAAPPFSAPGTDLADSDTAAAPVAADAALARPERAPRKPRGGTGYQPVHSEPKAAVATLAGATSSQPSSSAEAPAPESRSKKPRKAGFQPVPDDAPVSIEPVAAPNPGPVAPSSEPAPEATGEAALPAVAPVLAVGRELSPVSAPAEIALPAEAPVALEPVADEAAAPLPEATLDLAAAAAEKDPPAADLVPEPAGGTGYQPVRSEPASGTPCQLVAGGTGYQPVHSESDAAASTGSEAEPAHDAEPALVASAAFTVDRELTAVSSVPSAPESAAAASNLEAQTSHFKVKPITVLPVSLPAAARTGAAPVWGTAAPALHAESSRPQPEWRREVSNRVEAYRARRQRDPNDPSQSDLPFGGTRYQPVRSDSAPGAASDDFTTRPDEPHANGAPASTRPPESHADLEAIAARAALRYAARGRQNDTMEIATVQPELDFAASAALDDHPHAPLVPVADVADRRSAGLLDAGLLVISYGLFLILFSSLGGKLSWGKVDALIYAATFFLFYAQYFALFTVFGGVTPGMLVRGLSVVAFDGTAPAPAQLLWRSAGYLASAAALFLGFLWPLWDEDHLTWHDRMSHTYLTHAPATSTMTDPAPAQR